MKYLAEIILFVVRCGKKNTLHKEMHNGYQIAMIIFFYTRNQKAYGNQIYYQEQMR